MLDERLIAKFLREAPFFPGASDLGLVTCPVQPWPHQLRVARDVVRRFPESFLFCDEVGLGKTIEAGLALRQLVISGRVQRALLLVPGALVRQWQEELHEKLALSVPRYEKGRFLAIDGQELEGEEKTANPWDRHPLLLASSHLARRRERRDQLLAARPWDLILVDEAHHARRRGFRSAAFEPNRLLTLLAGADGRAGLKDHTRSLYLLTATPMQVHPLEVWDLLRLLGLGGAWGAREEDFLTYFESLRQPFAQRDWERLLTLWGESLRNDGGLAPTIRRRGQESLGEMAWSQVETLAARATEQSAEEGGGGALEAGTLAAGIDPAARPWVDLLLRHHTPLRRFAWRGTRELLRTYHRRGWLEAPIPERRPSNVWIAMSPEESELYRRIEKYVGEIYQRYEARRRGLGFVMTIYRRRLTSSFYAVQRSLERRLGRLSNGVADEDSRILDEDLPGFSDNGPEIPAEAPRDLFMDPEQETKYLRQFLRDLRRLPSDSKLERLRADLRRLLPTWRTALIFTQYTDTLDALREALLPEVGSQIATYSGRGGEIWNGEAWVACDKEQLKAAFRAGAKGDEESSGETAVRILLSTDAASEGLNLQTCGLLINFDMPWNPMRVEQRIGRLDRIGQEHGQIEILNYFFEGTVEAQVYQRLGDRIRWFEEVVGALQPILRQVGETIERIAMVPEPRRDALLAAAVADLEEELSSPPEPGLVEVQGLLDGLEDPCEERLSEGGPGGPLSSPVTCEQIEALFLASATWDPLFSARQNPRGSYCLRWRGRDRHVTFSPELFDQHPYSLELLTYGHPLFGELLDHLGEPASSEEPGGLGLYQTAAPVPVSLFLLPDGGGVSAVHRFEDLVAADLNAPWREAQEGMASSEFSRERQRELQHMNRVLEGRSLDRRRALHQAGRQLLVRAALVELERLRTPSLFEPPLPHGYGRRAVEYLARHGPPLARLLELVAGDEVPLALDTDPFAARIAGRSQAALDRAWTSLEQEAAAKIEELDHLETIDAEARRSVVAPSVSGLLHRVWYIPVGQETGERAGSREELDDMAELKPFRDAVPMYEQLSEALQQLGEPSERNQDAARRHPESHRWIALDGKFRPSPDLFVSPVVLQALDRRIPPGARCLFRLVAAGWRPRAGRLVLVQHRDILDPELGAGITLRLWDGATAQGSDAWGGLRIVLRPASSDPSFQPMTLELDEGDLDVVAEVVEVLG